MTMGACSFGDWLVVIVTSWSWKSWVARPTRMRKVRLLTCHSSSSMSQSVVLYELLVSITGHVLMINFNRGYAVI